MALEEVTGAEGTGTEDAAAEAEAAEQQQAETGAEDGEEQKAPSVEDIASRMGWMPKDKFKGDETKWKPAEDYIIAGREIQDRTARELREIRTTLDTVTRTNGQIMADKLREQHEELQAKYETAVAKGDPDEIWKTSEELRGVITARKSAAPPQAPAPETDDWVKKNNWFEPSSAAFDPVAHNRAVEICNEYAKAKMPAGEQLKRTEAIIRREFPHLFDDKAPPQVNGQSTRSTAAPAKKSGTYDDLPKAAKDMADDLLDRGMIADKEQYARNYFAQASKGQ